MTRGRIACLVIVHSYEGVVDMANTTVVTVTVLSDYPAPDFFSLTMDQVAELSYYRPDAFRLDLDHMPEPVKALMAGNRAALAVYGGPALGPPRLLGPLPGLTPPVLILLGRGDPVITG